MVAVTPTEVIVRELLYLDGHSRWCDSPLADCRQCVRLEGKACDTAVHILGALADEELVVVSDAAEPLCPLPTREALVELLTGDHR